MTEHDADDVDPELARKLEEKGELKQQILHILGDAPGDRKTTYEVQDALDDDYDEDLYEEALGELVREQRVAGVNGWYWEARDLEEHQFLYHD